MTTTDPHRTIAEDHGMNSGKRPVHVKDWAVTKMPDFGTDPECWWWDDQDRMPTTWTPEGQLALLRWWQKGRCGICGIQDRLVLDHEHSTSLARGYLCGRCNLLEGIRREPDDVYARWRACPATALLGLRFAYSVGGKGDPVEPIPGKEGGPTFLPPQAPDPRGWPLAPGTSSVGEFEFAFRTLYVVLATPAEAARIEAENAIRKARMDVDNEFKAWSRTGRRTVDQSPATMIAAMTELQEALDVAVISGADLTKKINRVRRRPACPTALGLSRFLKRPSLTAPQAAALKATMLKPASV